MKKITLTGVLIFITILSFAQLPPFQWAKGIGGSSEDIGNSIAVDAFGNTYTTGYFNGIVDFDPGAGTFNLDAGWDAAMFVLKLNATGNLVWAFKMGPGSNGKSVKLDPWGNIFVTGTFTGTVDADPGAGAFNLTADGSWSDMFVLKLTSAGNFIWAKSFGGSMADVSYSIAVDAEGNDYTTGYFEDTVDFNPGAATFNMAAIFFDIFILKLDSAGNFVFAKQFGGAQASEEASCIAVDDAQNIYTTGQINGTCDFDPGPGVYNLTSASQTNKNIFISKLDAAGNFAWAKRIGSSTAEGMGITIDPSGNVLTTGEFTQVTDFNPDTTVTFDMTPISGFDVFILKLTNSGNFIWAKQIGSILQDYGASIVTDGSENVYIAGYFGETADFDPGSDSAFLSPTGMCSDYILKLNSSGNYIWALQIGITTALTQAYSITVDAGENVFATGQFITTCDFNPDTVSVFNLTSNGMHDIFVWELGDASIGINENTITNTNSVYPVPTSGKFNLQVANAADGVSIEIYNCFGTLIYKQVTTAQQNTIDLSNEANGIYFIKTISNSSVITTKKIIKQ